MTIVLVQENDQTVLKSSLPGLELDASVINNKTFSYQKITKIELKLLAGQRHQRTLANNNKRYSLCGLFRQL